MAKLRVAFAGTPDFAATIFEAVLARHVVVAVYCQPARPAGRGRRPRPSPVERIARAHGLPVESPRTLRTPDAARTLASYRCDLVVVAAYGLILPQPILEVPSLGCINVHASLLPRWRGAAPVERALLAGDERTGVSIMAMDAGLDTGPVIARAACDILDTDTGDILSERLAHLGAQTLLPCLDDPHAWRPEPQSERGVTYAHKLEKSEALLDFSHDADRVARTIRALNGRLPAYSWLGAERVRLLFARPVAGNGPPGQILAFDRHALTVACGRDAVAATLVQLSRGKGVPLDAAALFNGYRDLFPVGARFSRFAGNGAPPRGQ